MMSDFAAQMKDLVMEQMTLADMKNLFAKLQSKDPVGANKFALFVASQMMPKPESLTLVITPTPKPDPKAYRKERSAILYQELSKCGIDDERTMFSVNSYCNDLGKAHFMIDALEYLKKMTKCMLSYMMFGGKIVMDKSLDLPRALVLVMEIGGECLYFGDDYDQAQAIMTLKTFVTDIWSKSGIRASSI